MALRALNLCDGYGGFELAWRSCSLPIRTVARVERDSYAAAVLVERMEAARLDLCPVWDDLTTFDGAAWRGRVDLITAGFPCQPWSAAGQQRGIDDPRWLWPAIARIVRDVAPRFVFLENVPGLNATRWDRSGLQYVLQDLADIGFDAEWSLLSAADVGAPHKRERFWILAHADRDGCDTQREPTVGQQERGPVAGSATSVGYATSLDERESHRQARSVSQRDARRNPGGPGIWPPGRDDHDGWRDWIAAGGPEPVLRRLTDGPPNGLADALHLGGNGLVPQCAAHAFVGLLNRAGWELM